MLLLHLAGVALVVAIVVAAVRAAAVCDEVDIAVVASVAVEQRSASVVIVSLLVGRLEGSDDLSVVKA